MTDNVVSLYQTTEKFPTGVSEKDKFNAQNGKR